MILETTATFTTDVKNATALARLLAARPGAFLVAEDAQGVAGFITWGPFRAGPGYAHTAEHTIITLRRGVAQGLMQSALVRAHGQGIHRMVAAISGENERAVAFHTRMGFAESGRLPQVGRKAGRWLDLVLMTRECAPS